MGFGSAMGRQEFDQTTGHLDLGYPRFSVSLDECRDDTHPNHRQSDHRGVTFLRLWILAKGCQFMPANKIK